MDPNVALKESPYDDLYVPYGLSDPFPAIYNPSGKIEQSFPDLIFAPAASKPYNQLLDPYEGQTRIPKILDTFFLARSNARTLALFKALQSLTTPSSPTQRILNALQHLRSGEAPGLNNLLNGLRFDSVLVDPLPWGVQARRKGWIDAVWWGWVRKEDVVRVRVLSQAAYSIGLERYVVEGEKGGDEFGWMRDGLAMRKEKEVVYRQGNTSSCASA
ncbi:hypothetical protein HK101_000949 [Irineochytrium annulatum]|nr:hypothetical protein HK101_000949 [Irineochytrium annulatum]